MKQLNILVGCEESQAVTLEFRNLGHLAFSCDLLDCSGGHPEYHYKDDFIKVAGSKKWDAVISIPPCTDLSLSGARWFEKKRISGEQEQSIKFFIEAWKLSNATENPKNIMTGWKYLKRWFPHLVKEMTEIGFPKTFTQAIQPWQFGHGETKETCLWLNDLPALMPTNTVNGRAQRIWKMPPGPDRGKLRSKTYSGIAKAMAHQWSDYLISKFEV